MTRKQIGALWARTYNKDGKEHRFMTGMIDLGALGTVDIAIFKNDRKEKDNHPDYRIVLSEKRQAVEKTEDGNDPGGYSEPF